MDRKEKIKGFIDDDVYTPMKEDEIAVLLSVPKEDREEFYSIIDELLKSGEIIKTKRGKIVSCKKMGYVTGIYRSTARAFGFVTREDGEDIFVPKDSSWGAMNGDNVVAEVIGADGERPEGRIVRIAERANKTVVGTLMRKNRDFYVEADNERLWQYLYIKKDRLAGALKGQKVLVKITKYPTDKERAEAAVLQVLGWPESSDTKMLSVIYSYGLEREFPEKVKKAAEKIPAEITEDVIAERTDLRGKTIITIDGEDAKDLDDAVSVEIKENGNFLLSVHIADVSHYVTEGSELDKEAFNRGTSVYLPGTVIPMLPPRLSNGVCSLNPAVMRLTLSVDMEFDRSGGLVGHNIYESVISTTERMTYNSVQKIIDGDNEEREKYSHILPMIDNMRRLAEILRNKRAESGYIDFDFPEAKIAFDDKMNVIGVFKYENKEANGIIEEFMLAANNCVAEHFYWLSAPFVYRVHENPETDKIRSLAGLLLSFGIKIKGSLEDIRPKALADILESVKGKPYEAVVAETMLRSMKKARYSTECLGHFGLSMQYYCHFTSPIRRYPDLMIHRIIKEYLKKGCLSDSREAELLNEAEEAAKRSSEREINAAEAERTATKIKIAEYMQAYIGYSFDGVVSSLTQFGMFVQLPNLVEGLVRLADMEDDYYNFFENGMYIAGEKSGKKYTIGQSVKVQLARVNDTNGELDFVLDM